MIKPVVAFWMAYLKVLMMLLLLAGMVSCTNDDADEPLIECPSPSYLSGIITQLEVIQKELANMEAQLPKMQGPDRDVLASRITKAKERRDVLLDELSNYPHCF